MDEGQLISRYLPADYCDCFSENIPVTKGLTVDALFDKMFCDHPLPVKWMLRLRDVLVNIFLFHKLIVGHLLKRAIK